MNTTANLPSALSEFYDRVFLTRAKPLLLFSLFGQNRPLKTKNSKIIKFRKYNALAASTTPLTEGVTPAGNDLSVTDMTATVAQYGDYIKITDMVDLTNPDPVLTEGAQVLGDQAGLSIDTLVRDVLVAGTSVAYSNGANRAAVNTIIDKTMIAKRVRLLKNQNARKISAMLSAGVGFNTTPINSAYIGFIHPDVGYTVKGLTGFVPVEKYPSQGQVLPGEIGSIEEVRFIESTQSPVFAGAGAAGGTAVKESGGNADVYATIIVAANAYGIVPLDMNAGIIVKPLGSGGTEDPLEQRATEGWKVAFTSKILNDAFMTRIESAATE